MVGMYSNSFSGARNTLGRCRSTRHDLSGQPGVYPRCAARLLALDRGFAYVASENVVVTSAAPVSVGWNGSALLVYDDGIIDFYGSEQAEVVTSAEVNAARRQYRSRAFQEV